MSSNFDDVGAFHRKFDLPVTTDGRPREIDSDLIGFRWRFLIEELGEFFDGMADNDHAQMFDALIDLVYVALGTAHLLNYPWQRGWDAVQAANMGKIRAARDGSDSKRGSGWDVVKPDGWQPPDIAAILAPCCPACKRTMGPMTGCTTEPDPIDATLWCGLYGRIDADGKLSDG